MTAKELMEAAENAGCFFVVEDNAFKLIGKDSQEFVQRYREEIKRNKQAIRALLRGETPPISDDDIAERARLEFTLAFYTKLEAEAEKGVPEWLEWAFWYLFNDAMEGFVRWGLGEHWPQVQEAAQERQQAIGMRERALERWARVHVKRERHRYKGEIEPRDQFALECETWAWRAYLVEVALRNPEGNDQQQLDLWVDLEAWALWLARNGRAHGLVWNDREAA